MIVLAIGNDRKIFEEGSSARKKASEIATLFDEYYIITHAEKSLGLKTQRISRNAWAIPTNSLNRWMYPYDAIRIGNKMSEIGIVSCQDPFESGLAGYFIAKHLKAKLQLQVHTDFLNSNFRSGFLNKIRIIIADFLIPRADLIRVVSSRIKKSLKRYKLKARVFILPVFVDTQKILSSEIKFDLHQKYNYFSKIILIVSRLEKEKRIGLALDVFKEVSDKYQKTALVVVGDGSLKKSLQNKVKSLNLEEKVFFEGWQGDLISYYKTSDIYLSTSLYEGYGLSMIEASLSGLPVVTTDAGIAGDVLINGVNSMICPVDDKKCLASAILELMKDKKLHDKLKRNALNISDKIAVMSKYKYLEDYRKTLTG